MSNYLNILLIIIALFVSSCSKNSDDTANMNTFVSSKNFGGDKYSHLYNSLYINLALKKSLHDEALRTFIQNIEKMDDVKLFEKLSKISRDTNRFNYSQIISERWIEIDDNSYLAYMYALSASIDNSNFDKAGKYFNDFVRVSAPRDKRDYAKLIFFIIENKNRINVVNFFEEYLEKNENYALHVNFIELLYSYNLHEKVIEHIDKVGTYGDRSLTRIYANSLGAIGNKNMAISILEKYISNKISSDRQVELELLEIYLEEKNIVFSENFISTILAKDPDNPDTLFKISTLLHDKGLYLLSEKYLSYMVIENDRVNIMRGLNDYMLGNYAESIEHFKRVRDFNYKLLSHINISSSLNQLYGLDRALEYLESVRQDYEDKNINLNLALHQISLLNENNMYEKVIEFCNKFLIEDPSLTNILYARAMAYENLEKIDLMENDLRKILSIDSKNSNTLNALGYSLIIHTKRYDEAYNLLIKAYHYDPGNAAILDSIAWVEYKKGNYTNALNYIEASYNRDKDPEIIEHYCEILIKNKQFKKLQKVIELELKRNKNNLEFINKLNSYHNDSVI
jgi:tetratricopeptide (TPR) repeat protein